MLVVPYWQQRPEERMQYYHPWEATPNQTLAERRLIVLVAQRPRLVEEIGLRTCLGGPNSALQDFEQAAAEAAAGH